jgi:hypothetical protein
VQQVRGFLAAQRNLSWEDLGQVHLILMQAREELTAVRKQAGNLVPPPLKHVKPSEPLARILPGGRSLRDLGPGLPPVDAAWLEELERQIGGTVDRLNRIQVKSLGGILALQEQLSGEGCPGAGDERAQDGLQVEPGESRP